MPIFVSVLAYVRSCSNNRRMPAVNFNSTWFRCYTRAKFETDSHALTAYVRAAIAAAEEALIQSNVEDGERRAIAVALSDLHRMERGNGRV